jgi:uncharacterized protein
MNLYQAHIDATDNEDAKKVLAFIAKDEKEHYALFVELVRRLDPEQAQEFSSAGPKLDDPVEPHRRCFGGRPRGCR